MSLRVYNTLTKEKELFTPVRSGKVGIYLCGPTVYKSPHIGHMVGPVIFDAIKRYLQYKGFEVNWIVNITDIEDKLIDAAIKQNTTVQALVDKHTPEYFDALKMLGIEGIDKFPRATEHMAEIINICKALVDNGHAYVADGNVWFDVTRDPDYGKLSHRRVEDQESGLRQLEGSGKKNPADFGLWKAAKPGEPSWDSPWGKGRPGWHIECSAMSMKYLGETFDMHGGGMDLMFPHHENEIAQSESATGKPFAKFWMHNGLTKVRTKARSGDAHAETQSQDMHESSGNAIRIKPLIDQHGAALVRYLLLMTHYRRPIDFSDEVLAAAKKGMSNFDRLFERIERLSPDASKQANLESIASDPFTQSLAVFKQKFLDAMDDDFNTAGAIGVLQQIAGEINSQIEKSGVEKDRSAENIRAVVAATNMLRELGGLLGLFRKITAPAVTQSASRTESHEKPLADELMALVLSLRASARQRKDFATADAIRDGLARLKITVEDRADGSTWRKE